jgi:hypothetical protein
MSDESIRSGQVSATPEGGPIAEGVPTYEPGAGQVLSTPEAAPLPESEELVPPTWREHMRGPILGADGLPHGQGVGEPQSASAPSGPAAAREEVGTAQEIDAAAGQGVSNQSSVFARSPQDDAELRKWPPYVGKPVSEVRWDALRYAAPVVSQAEKLTIKAIDLSGRGLSKLAQYLETRRQERDAGQQEQSAGDR